MSHFQGLDNLAEAAEAASKRDADKNEAAEALGQMGEPQTGLPVKPLSQNKFKIKVINKKPKSLSPEKKKQQEMERIQREMQREMQKAPPQYIQDLQRKAAMQKTPVTKKRENMKQVPCGKYYRYKGTCLANSHGKLYNIPRDELLDCGEFERKSISLKKGDNKVTSYRCVQPPGNAKKQFKETFENLKDEIKLGLEKHPELTHDQLKHQLKQMLLKSQRPEIKKIINTLPDKKFHEFYDSYFKLLTCPQHVWYKPSLDKRGNCISTDAKLFKTLPAKKQEELKQTEREKKYCGTFRRVIYSNGRQHCVSTKDTTARKPTEKRRQTKPSKKGTSCPKHIWYEKTDKGSRSQCISKEGQAYRKLPQETKHQFENPEYLRKHGRKCSVMVRNDKGRCVKSKHIPRSKATGVRNILSRSPSRSPSKSPSRSPSKKPAYKPQQAQPAQPVAHKQSNRLNMLRQMYNKLENKNPGFKRIDMNEELKKDNMPPITDDEWNEITKKKFKELKLLKHVKQHKIHVNVKAQ